MSDTIDFKFMTVKRVAELVGHDPLEIKDEGKWIVCVYGNMTVSFKKW